MPEVGLAHLHRGKVRDLYDAGDGRLLMVASDRLSAFDVVMAEPVPDKGRVLTAMSVFWFDLLASTCPNHLVSAELSALPTAHRDPRLAAIAEAHRDPERHRQSLRQVADEADDAAIESRDAVQVGIAPPRRSRHAAEQIPEQLPRREAAQ